MSSFIEKLSLKGKRVLVTRIIEEEKGGILLPTHLKQGNDKDGDFTVVSVGDKVEEPLIKVGEKVFLAGNTYREFSNEDNKPVYMVMEGNILGVYPKDGS